MAQELRFDDVRKEFGSIVAVDDVSMTISEGSFTTLVGPSGSGKTTLLRILAGLEKPTGGRVYFDGEDMTDRSPQDRPISMVFQNVALFPHMSCRRNIGYGLEIHGVPADERNERVEEAARQLQITDQLDKAPSELSGGQQQRVALGRAFVEDPEVLLLDEPMSDLDAKLKEDLRVEFQRLHRRLDATFVYVTHDQNEAMTMSDHIAVMRAGTVEQYDPPETVFHDPVSQHVATFIGTPSTNVVTCPVEDGKAVLPGVSISLPPSATSLPTVTVGIRPQYLAIGGGDVEFEVTVDVIETLGIDYVVHTTLPGSGEKVDVVTPDVSGFDPGDRVTVGAPLDAIYLFTPDGDRIRHQSPGETEPETEV